MRLNDAEFTRAIESNVIVPLILFDLATTPPIRMHSAEGSIAYDGNTYIGAGKFGGIDKINESQFLQPEQITLSLSGFPTPPGVNLDDVEYKNKKVKLTMLLLNKDTKQQVGAALPLFAGEADVLTVSYGETVSYALTVSNELAAWKEGSNKIWSDKVQQALYPGDLGLQYLTELEEKEIVW